MPRKTKTTSRKRRTDKVMSVRMPTETYDKVARRAQKMDMNAAEYIRQLIRLGDFAESNGIYTYDKDGNLIRTLVI